MQTVYNARTVPLRGIRSRQDDDGELFDLDD